MSTVPSSSSEVSSPPVPSAVEAFAGSPGPNSPRLPQADGAAAPLAAMPEADDSPVEPPRVASPADMAQFGNELSQSIAEAMAMFTCKQYAPLRRVVCSLVGRLLSETMLVIDEAMCDATELPQYHRDGIAAKASSVVLVTPPEGWKPIEATDVPPNVEVKELLSIRCAEAFAGEFNRREIDEPSGRWAIGPAVVAAACGKGGAS